MGGNDIAVAQGSRIGIGGMRRDADAIDSAHRGIRLGHWKIVLTAVVEEYFHQRPAYAVDTARRAYGHRGCVVPGRPQAIVTLKPTEGSLAVLPSRALLSGEETAACLLLLKAENLAARTTGSGAGRKVVTTSIGSQARAWSRQQQIPQQRPIEIETDSGPRHGDLRGREAYGRSQRYNR